MNNSGEVKRGKNKEIKPEKSTESFQGDINYTTKIEK